MSTSPVDLRRVSGAVATRRDVVRVTGNDATTFLQGQLSADLLALKESDSTWAFLLEPTGRTTALLRATRHGEGWLLDLDAGFGTSVQERLARFKLRVAVELRLEEAVPVLAIRGPGAAELAATSVRADHEDRALQLDAGWPGVEGIDLLALDTSGDAIPGAAPDAVPDAMPGALPDAALDAVPELPAGVVAASDDDLHALRIVLGVPAMGAEITQDTIPGELGSDLLARAVSFTKGCYTGQELVARIDSRGGNVPRPIRRLETAAAVQVGDDVLLEGDVVGQVTSAASHPAHGNVALAPLARRVEPGAPGVVVRSAGPDAAPEVAAEVFAIAGQ